MNLQSKLLTEPFLIQLYKACASHINILAICVNNLQSSYLPNRDFIAVHKAFVKFYQNYKAVPTRGELEQSLQNPMRVSDILDEVFAAFKGTPEAIIDNLESYIRQVELQKSYKESAAAYNKGNVYEASQILVRYANWSTSFSLRPSSFVNVIEEFEVNLKRNKEQRKQAKALPPVTRFYIDELDQRNNGRNLRTQLTCFLASTGVGKSHVARWIGKNAAEQSALNVLHFQLEGSEKEVVDAYSASFAKVSSYKVENGYFEDGEIEEMAESANQCQGRVFVRSFPKFNNHVSTIDIRNGIREFAREHGIKADVVIVDSIDLLTDASGRKYGENGERHKRVAVVQDLKDLAAEENVWIVGTYQSTIENREWLNDESNVLTEYNTAEAKGISRPLTHLITLNQSTREKRERTMRLNVAKSRFFENGDVIKIATDYDNEQFYDRARTLRAKGLID